MFKFESIFPIFSLKCSISSSKFTKEFLWLSWNRCLKRSNLSFDSGNSLYHLIIVYISLREPTSKPVRYGSSYNVLFCWFQLSPWLPCSIVELCTSSYSYRKEISRWFTFLGFISLWFQWRPLIEIDPIFCCCCCNQRLDGLSYLFYESPPDLHTTSHTCGRICKLNYRFLYIHHFPCYFYRFLSFLEPSTDIITKIPESHQCDDDSEKSHIRNLFHESVEESLIFFSFWFARTSEEFVEESCSSDSDERRYYFVFSDEVLSPIEKPCLCLSLSSWWKCLTRSCLEFLPHGIDLHICFIVWVQFCYLSQFPMGKSHLRSRALRKWLRYKFLDTHRSISHWLICHEYSWSDDLKSIQIGNLWRFEIKTEHDLYITSLDDTLEFSLIDTNIH